MYEVDKDRMTMTRWRAIITLELLQVTFHLFNWLPLCSTQCVCVYEGYTMCVINTYLHVWASKVLVGKVSNWQSVVEESLHYERRLDWSFQVQVSLRLSGANVAVFNHTDRDNFLPSPSSFLDLVALNWSFAAFTYQNFTSFWVVVSIIQIATIFLPCPGSSTIALTNYFEALESEMSWNSCPTQFR